ncbi:YiiX/YebB-like N1pC/P60 family cysteine hydrolase [Brevibacillus laterosporus]|uniref:YiiX/YebB-like N1pC/P60 family cysteine hydrolase n=1 Tax=Brevibacillus laterosporus TaxID=1465 RepID=UPI001443F609|nr:YiiX/YebB-like N1pC/P60 family cysteine hydrolase [Brevibacillus laterosporus]NKQ21359.1 distant relative of cell wall-associated hydrolase-like protein [Brevibacillus laterosporus]WNX31212.1 YiiX/YebB-like N1pC/P60 family cysteine hydrolase [Brevibacillus laterosporus]
MKIKNGILFLAIAALTVSAVPTLTQASQELEEGYLDMSSPEIQAELKRKIKETEIARTKALQGKVHSMIAEDPSLDDLKKNAPEKYKQIQEEQQKVQGLASSGRMGTVGDILITYDNKTSVWRHGHAAIVRKNNDYIVEAWPEEGVRNYKNNWGNRFDSALKLYVKGADDTDYINAQKFAYGEKGKPYKLNVAKHFTSSYYCSKLVWKAWDEQGFDVDADGGFIVTPADIENSKNTVEY